MDKARLNTHSTELITHPKLHTNPETHPPPNTWIGSDLHLKSLCESGALHNTLDSASDDPHPALERNGKHILLLPPPLLFSDSSLEMKKREGEEENSSKALWKKSHGTHRSRSPLHKGWETKQEKAISHSLPLYTLHPHPS